MSRKFVRVDLPVGKPDSTVKLAQKIIAHNTALGVGSPFAGGTVVNMADVAAVVASIIGARTPATQNLAKKQADNEKGRKIFGIDAGQSANTTGTIYHDIIINAKWLKIKSQNNEEQASLYGFPVTVNEANGRRNVAFNIPYTSPEALITLATTMLNKHTTDGVDSLLIGSGVDMGDFEDNLTSAVALFTSADTEEGQSQASYEQALALIGYAEGQTSNTENTLYFYLGRIRDALLVINDGNEEQLSVWGFNVVASEAMTGRRTNGGDKKVADNPTPPTT